MKVKADAEAAAMTATSRDVDRIGASLLKTSAQHSHQEGAAKFLGYLIEPAYAESDVSPPLKRVATCYQHVHCQHHANRARG